jgi:hypothetical protein
MKWGCGLVPPASGRSLSAFPRAAATLAWSPAGGTFQVRLARRCGKGALAGRNRLCRLGPARLAGRLGRALVPPARPARAVRRHPAACRLRLGPAVVAAVARGRAWRAASAASFAAADRLASGQLCPAPLESVHAHRLYHTSLRVRGGTCVRPPHRHREPHFHSRFRPGVVPACEWRPTEVGQDRSYLPDRLVRP